MNTKILVLAISTALLAAAESLAQFASQLPDDVELPGVITANSGFAEQAPQITHTAIAAVELDVDGMPWDERIHASTKTQTQKKVWTQRKGVDDAVREAVTAELRQKYPAPAAATPVATTPPVVATTPVVPSVPSVPTLTAAVVTPYTQLVDWLAKNTGAGKILSDEWIKSMFAQNNTTLAALANDLDLAGEMLTALRGVLVQAGVAEVA